MDTSPAFFIISVVIGIFPINSFFYVLIRKSFIIFVKCVFWNNKNQYGTCRYN